MIIVVCVLCFVDFIVLGKNVVVVRRKYQNFNISKMEKDHPMVPHFDHFIVKNRNH